MATAVLKVPGVYRQEQPERSRPVLPTGVPAFVGLVQANAPVPAGAPLTANGYRTGGVAPQGRLSRRRSGVPRARRERVLRQRRRLLLRGAACVPTPCRPAQLPSS